jgi:quercetin dioxygenase-like cupin family protein
MTTDNDHGADPVRELLASAPGLRVQLVTIEAGQQIPQHCHTSVSDTIIAVAGVVDVEVEGEGHHLLRGGERWTIPAGTVHSVSGERSARCVFVNLHAGGEYDFQLVSSPDPRDTL